MLNLFQHPISRFKTMPITTPLVRCRNKFGMTFQFLIFFAVAPDSC